MAEKLLYYTGKMYQLQGTNMNIVLPDNLDQQFLRSFLELEKEVRGHLAASDSCHDFDHTCRVVAHAVTIGRELPEARTELYLTAALLHDIARPEEAASRGTRCHAELGAIAAYEIAQRYGFCAEDCQIISDCVATHRYRKQTIPATLEAKIVFDADKLDSLGAIGIGRAFLFAGKIGARLHNSEMEALSSPAYSREDTAFREYLVKLRHLPEVMFTAPGRRLAHERMEIMRVFFDNLQRECEQ